VSALSAIFNGIEKILKAIMKAENEAIMRNINVVSGEESVNHQMK
jgi:hypothetical protein